MSPISIADFFATPQAIQTTGMNSQTIAGNNGDFKGMFLGAMNNQVTQGQAPEGNSQGFSNELKQLLSLLSLLFGQNNQNQKIEAGLMTQDSTTDSNQDDATQTTISEIANGTNINTNDKASIDITDTIVDSNSQDKAFDGFLSELQTVLAIFLAIFAPSQTSQADASADNPENSQVATNLTDTMQEMGQVGDNSIGEMTIPTVDVSVSDTAADIETDILNDQANSINLNNDSIQNSIKQSLKTETPDISNIDELSHTEDEPTDDISQNTSEKNIQQTQYQDSNSTLAADNGLQPVNPSFLGIKDVDITFSNFELHKNTATPLVTGKQFAGQSEIIQTSDMVTDANYIAKNISLAETSKDNIQDLNGMEFIDLYGQKANASATGDDGKKFDAQFAQIFGTLKPRQDSEQSSSANKNREFTFKYQSVHLSISASNANDNVGQNNGEIMVIDFNDKNGDDLLKQSTGLGSKDSQMAIGMTADTGQTINADGTKSQSAANVNLSNNPLDRSIMSQVTDGLHDIIRLNKSRAILHLNPPELGSVRVNLSIDHNHHVQASFIADHPETKQIIEANLQHLKDQLSQNGFSLSQVNIDLGAHGQAQDQGQQWFAGNGNGSGQSFSSQHLAASDEQATTQAEGFSGTHSVSEDNGLHIVI